MAITIDNSQAYNARVSSEYKKVSSLEEMKAGLLSLKNSTTTGVLPSNHPMSELVDYQASTKKYVVNGVDVSYGMGPILASDNLKLKLTDNSYKTLVSRTTGVPDAVELTNYNAWIRSQYQAATGNYDTTNPLSWDPSTGKLIRNAVTEEKIAQLATVKPEVRQIGQIKINSNYELEFAGPLDARIVTKTPETLVDPTWWLTAHKRPVYFYTGMAVTVESTGQMYIYMGYNICLKRNDVTTRYTLSMKFWKRASFEIEDIVNSGIVMPAITVKDKCTVRTHSRSSWSDTNGMFMTTTGTTDGIGITISDHMILAGQNINYKQTLQSHQRDIRNKYGIGADGFIGLSIIPIPIDVTWGNNAFHSTCERVELSNVDGPTYITNTYYDKDASGNYFVEPNTTSVIGLNYGTISINAPKNISLTTDNIDITDATKITMGDNARILANDGLSIDNGGLLNVSTRTATMKTTSSLYISSGHEMNVAAGAVALHTTGYHKKKALADGAILLQPVNFNIRRKFMYSNDASNAQVVRNIDVSIFEDGKDDEQRLADNAKRNLEIKEATKPVKQLNAYYPGLDYNYQSTFFGADTSITGFKNETNKTVAPLTELSAFQTKHSENLRISPDLLNRFAVEVGKESDTESSLTILDLSDVHNFTNAKEIKYYTDKKKWEADISTQLRKEDPSSGADTAASIINDKISILNLKNQVWINKELAVGTAINQVGDKVSLDKGYTILGSVSMLDKQEVQSFIDLVNTGTISLESFGDTSIYSHYGQVKLGLDNMVRITRDKRFVIENSGKDAYVSFTPRGTTIRNTTHTTVNGKRKEKIDGFIALESDTIKLWEDGYVLPKPKNNDSYLTFTIQGTTNTEGNSFGLDWKSLDTASTTVTVTDIINKYPELGLTETNLNRPWLYCIGEFIIPSAEITGKTELLSLNVYLSTYYFHGDVKLSIKIRPNSTDRSSYNGMFTWEGLYPIDVTMVDNTEVVNPFFEASDNHTQNVSPLWIGAYYQWHSDQDKSEETGRARYRIYTPCNGTLGCSYFTHSLETWSTSKIDWTNTPDTIAYEFEKYANNNTYKTPIAKNVVKYSEIGLGKAFTVIPFNKIKDGICKWSRLTDQVTKTIDTFVKTIKITKPVRVEIDSYNEEQKLFDFIVPDKSRASVSDYFKPTVLCYTQSTEDPSTRQLQWLTGEEFSTKFNITAGGGSSGTGTAVTKQAVTHLTKETNQTGTKSVKHYVMSYDYTHNNHNNTIDTQSYLYGSVATHNSVYYDNSGDLNATNFFSTSDKRAKKNIEPLKLKGSGVLPELVQFTFTSTNIDSYGLIAQELEEAGYPELISIEDNGLKRVNYHAAYALYIKQLQNQIDELRSEIQALKH